MIAIVTGTIKPIAQMGQLVLRDEKERLKQYKDGLQFLLEEQAFDKIIFCENSNYGMQDFEKLQQMAKENHIQMELFSFAGDAKQAELQGKGYGEGEIMQYVFTHSELLHQEKFFVKITGRLKIDNIKRLTGKLKAKRTYFNVPNHNKRDIYDTRIYAMPVKQYEELFLDAYKQVTDSQGIYLEHVYTGVLLKKDIKVFNFPLYPRIVGMSGSGGALYEYIEWKCKIRDILSKFNFYRVKEQ